MLEQQQQKNNRYFLMRHGESLANRQGLIVSKPENALHDYGLTTRGAEQVLRAALSTRLKRDTLIITSDYKRALETAEIMRSVIDCEARVYLETRLRERDFGDWELRNHSNYETIWQDDLVNPETSSMGVESIQQTLSRTQSLISDLEQEYQSKTILLVGHGDLLQVLMAYQNGIPARFHRSLKCINNADIRSLTKPELVTKLPVA